MQYGTLIIGISTFNRMLHPKPGITQHTYAKSRMSPQPKYLSYLCPPSSAARSSTVNVFSQCIENMGSAQDHVLGSHCRTDYHPVHSAGPAAFEW